MGIAFLHEMGPSRLNGNGVAPANRVIGDVPQGKYRVRAVDRALSLLSVLHEHGPRLGLAELSQALALHKSTVHRLLVVLERNRFVERDARDGRYRLGIRLFELGWTARASFDITAQGRPYLERLMEQTGETAYLCILDEDEMLSIANVESARASRALFTVGKRVHPYCTSVGKSVLAYMDPDDVDRIVIKHPLRAHTRRTITSLPQLRAELNTVRARGYAIDDEEFEEGLRCIGAPIRDCTGQPIAAISIAGPTIRVTNESVPRIAELVMKASEELSRDLGYRG